MILGCSFVHQASDRTAHRARENDIKVIQSWSSKEEVLSLASVDVDEENVTPSICSAGTQCRSFGHHSQKVRIEAG
jgi:hypothetical protein